MKSIHWLFIALLFLSSCQKDIIDDSDRQLNEQLEQALLDASNGQGKDYFILPSSTDFNRIPQDPKNPLSAEKVALGQLLYHETGLALSAKKEAGKGTYSCASCHFASAGFQACRVQGIAEGGLGFGLNGEGRQKSGIYTDAELDVQPIRSPSAMNTAYQELMLWNGQFGATGANAGTEALWPAGTPIANNHLGYQGLEIQAIAGLTVHRMNDIRDFIVQSAYKEKFDDAYPEVPEDKRYDLERTGLAIAAYERTVLANKAPFQQWLQGDQTAMTEAEKEGAILFFGKAKCANCHSGPALSSMTFHALGMKDLYMVSEVTFLTSSADEANLGRASFTKKAEDNYKFKVPQLYNLADSPFYGHGSSFRTLRDVVAYKNKGVAENSNVPAGQLATDFVPLGLSDPEIDQITAFLTHALQDPSLARYQPQLLPSGNCTPFNDPMAKSELGCD